MNKISKSRPRVEVRKDEENYIIMSKYNYVQIFIYSDDNQVDKAETDGRLKPEETRQFGLFPCKCEATF